MEIKELKQAGGQPIVPSNIIFHRPNIIGQELNSVPALDEAGTELKKNNSGLGRKYYRPGRGRDGVRFSERGIFPALDGNIFGLGRN